MKRYLLRAALASALLLAGAGQASAAQSGMTPFVPPPPSGWTSTMPPSETDDENGIEPMVSQGYGPATPGAPGSMSITFTHPSPHDMPSRFEHPRPLGPNPFAPQFVTSLVKVNGLDAYLIYDAPGRGGVLQVRVGRVLVGIVGGEVTPEQIVGLASSIDTGRLLKY
ncbi:MULTISPECIES: hypothetical protein [unclassified Phenylobacterium]|uniref:hypothetical protein n=1 Tax=unclassified Phenylobacterium TaxID=2640670 RepID=UPI0022B417BC|nr:hypothetical protein [Phenylobacterium sp. NIBR 498073]MBS0491823.1 hypothetical protein [Pseudomonadota bacterium]WGU41708.1 hypothetical protein O4N75_08265 [Phenylobacterium sp. NIBR 498073]